jgi:hypothetical protein
MKIDSPLPIRLTHAKVTCWFRPAPAAGISG